MLRQIKFTLITLALFSNCATTPKTPPPKPARPQPIKASTQGENKAQKKMAQKMQAVNPVEDLVLWTLRLSTQETVYTIKDRQILTSLPSSPKSGSLNEAALVIGILRDILTPPGGLPNTTASVQQTSSDTLVIPKEGPTADPQNSLENRTRERGIDLTAALTVNQMLKTSTVFTWTWNAILLEGNSEAFRQNLTSVIKAEAILWQEIAKKAGVLDPAAVMAAQKETDLNPAPVAGNVAATALTESATPQPTPSGDPNSGSSSNDKPMTESQANLLLAGAQEAAIAENFEKAIGEAAKIPPTAPNYEIAKENQRVWSNRAVTDLRKKAAFEYRSATSITDNASKKASLTKAKKYLEDALAKFPMASNLDTVKDNLKMIDGEMEKLP